MKFLLTLLIFINLIFANSEFESLLKSLKSEAKVQTTLESEREERFLKEIESRSKLLKEAKDELKALRDKRDRLKEEFNSNIEKLNSLNQNFKLNSKELANLFQINRDFAKEFERDFKDSIGYIAFRDREIDFKSLQSLTPTLKDIKTLWILMLERLDSSSKISKLDSEVIDLDSKVKIQEVTKYGEIVATLNGESLTYENQTLLRVDRGELLLSSLRNYLLKDSIEIDLSENYLLSKSNSTLLNKIEEAGVIGYIILTLGLIGFLIALFRYIYLTYISYRVKRQLKDFTKVDLKNPLGRVIHSYQNIKDRDFEEIEIELEGVVVSESPKLKRGESLLKVLIAISPLLGLLGTVVGMIETFQSITTFGESDIKLVSGGISQALTTTVLGLSVAIPLLLFHSIISQKSRYLIEILHSRAVGLIIERFKSE